MCTILGSKNLYKWPLSKSNGYSSSFQEFRGNHFHAGIDIRTFRKTGLPVYAIENGVIIRIRSVKRGSGRGIYIKHKDGNTSIYFHLEKFIPKLERVLNRYRKYTGKKYFGNYTLRKPIEIYKGSLIGYSGETGSGFPHLHLEIRDSKNRAVNPFKLLEFPNTDKNVPEIKNLLIRSIGNTKINGINGEVFLDIKKKGERISKSEVLNFDGEFEIVLGVHDISDTGRNVAPYKISATLNKSKIFLSRFDSFKWEDNNQLGFIYDMLYSSMSTYFFNIFSQSGYKLLIKGFTTDQFFNMLKPGKNSLILIVTDNFGNHSVLEVPLKKSEEKSPENRITVNKTPPDNYNYLSGMKDLQLKTFINRNKISVKVIDRFIGIKNIVLDIYEENGKKRYYPYYDKEGVYFTFSPQYSKSRNYLDLDFSIFSDKKLCFAVRKRLSIILLKKEKASKYDFNNFNADFSVGSVLDDKLILFGKKEIPSEFPVLSGPVSVYPYTFPYLGKVIFTFTKRADNPKQAGIFKYSFLKKKWRYVNTLYNAGEDKYKIRQISGGAFALLRDIFPPDIRSIRCNSLTHSKIKKLFIVITDKGKGINDESIILTINGNKVESEYDPDRNSLFISKPGKEMRRGKNRIKVSVEDRGGNISEKTFFLTLK